MTDSLALHEAYPILAILRAPFAMIDFAAGQTAETFVDLEQLARAVHARRGGRGLRITGDPAIDRLVWGDQDEEQRPVLRVDFTSRMDSDRIEERLTVLARGKTAEQLRDALLATRPQRKAA